MFTRWKHHLWAVLILAAAGLSTVILPPSAAWPEGSRTLPFLMQEQMDGTLGTRFFGYGALVLLGLALSIGPLSRLRPRLFARFMPYRRPVGIWSALAAVAHLLFVLQMVSSDFYRKTWLTLFVHEYVWYGENGQRMVDNRLQLDTLSGVAWTGLIALLLLLIIALVSNDWSQRFLGQATWKLVQQWSYTAFLFVSLHLLIMRWGGKMKLAPPLTRWVFWLLGGVALLQFAGFVYTVWKRRSGRGGADAAA